MRFGTINTILNNAPLVIQGASRLIKMIKERNNDDENTDSPDTLEGLTAEVEKLNNKLDANSAADVQQIELIEQLARQNESLAASLKDALKRQTLITWIAGIALILSCVTLIIIFQKLF